MNGKGVANQFLYMLKENNTLHVINLNNCEVSLFYFLYYENLYRYNILGNVDD